MTKSDDISKSIVNPKKKLTVTFDDVVPENSDGTIKIKKVSEFLGADVTKLKIVGEIKSYNHGNITHYELIFIIRNNKTNEVEKLVIDIAKKHNESKGKGVVSSVVTPDASVSSMSMPKQLAVANVGDQVTVSGSKAQPSEWRILL